MSAGGVTPERVGAVVLAGGRSSRFGRDKLAEPIDGRPLLDHAIVAVLAVASDVVVVVAPDADRPVPDGVRVVRDAIAFEGPLAGLATGLAALAADVEGVIVVAGDMPTLSPDVLRLLLGVLDGSPAIEATVLDDGGPMPMAVRRAAALVAARDLLAAGERRLRALPVRLLAEVLPGTMWRSTDPAGLTLRDIDRPTDLSSVQEPP
jgi:molybdopterin-guanine dinucleotide biosynthesis protein A